MSEVDERSNAAAPPLLSIGQLADLLSVSPSLLAKWRMTGTGPRYAKLGRRILYDANDVSTWLKSQKRSST